MKLTKKQLKQEEEYFFPYHYLDLVEGFRLVEFSDYLSVVRKLLGKVNLKDKKILDAGCGDGRFCYSLKGKCLNVTGIDYSAQAIRFAKAFNPKYDFYTADLCKFSLPKKFDYIVSIETLEHIELDKVGLFLKNIHKMLDKKGKLILTVPSKNVKVGSKHYQHFDVKSLEKNFNGLFKIEKVIAHGKYSWLHNKLFKLVLTISYLFEGLGSKRYIPSLRKFYRKHLGKCKLSQAKRLIVLARKL
jgi:SAM-dependent methyltransferase